MPSKVKDKLLHFAPLATKKESATSGRLLLVLEAVYSSLENTALTHTLDDIRLTTLSGAQSMEHSAVGLCYNRNSPAV